MNLFYMSLVVVVFRFFLYFISFQLFLSKLMRGLVQGVLAGQVVLRRQAVAPERHFLHLAS
jgi:hypothetical protein